MKNLLFIIILLGFVSAQENVERYDSLISSGIDQIYNLTFEDAHNTFELVSTEYPASPAGNFFDAMVIWWQIMIDFNNTELDDILVDKLDEVIDMCDEILDDDPQNIDALFFKGGALGFRGKLFSVRESWFDAALDGKDALPIVHEAFAVDSTNMDVQLGFGIYNYYAEMIPEKYPAVKPFMLFFPDGDKERGIAQLEQAAKDGKYSKYEAQYFLMTLFYIHENNFTRALYHANQLTQKFPDNPIFQRHLGRIYVKMGNYTKASPVFKDVLKKVETKQRGYSESFEREAYYYLGQQNFKENNLDSSKHYFNKSERVSRLLLEKEYKRTGYLSKILLYLGMIEDLSGNREEAVKYYEAVLDEKEFRDSHIRAEELIDKPYKR